MELLFAGHRYADTACANRADEVLLNLACGEWPPLLSASKRGVLTSGNLNYLCSDKLSLKNWLSVLKKHFNSFLEILPKFIECLTLTVSA